MLKEIIENIKKEVIKESSLSRIWEHYTKHQTGTISAFRYAPDCGEGTPYTLEENKKRNAKLKALLLKNGYGVTKIDGTYIENYGTPEAREVDEESFFVVDLKDKGNLKKDLIKFGKMFEQDSITFAEPNGEYYLISSNECPNGYPGEGKIGVEEKLGKPEFGKASKNTDMFFSKIRGRGFVFKGLSENLITLEKLSNNEKLSVVKMSKDVEGE